MRIAELHAIRCNLLQIKRSHPLEYHVWDAVLTVWLMACVGSLGIVALELWTLATVTLPALLLPDGYVRWRRRAHACKRLRCDWLPPSRTA